MALLALENFSIYGRSTANLARRWGIASNGSSIALVAGGRNSQDAMRYYVSTDTAAGLIYRVFANQATWIVGFAFKVAGAISAVADICSLLDTADLQVDVRLNGNGTIYVTRNGTTLGTSVYQLLPDQWYYIELKTTIHSTTGSIEVRVNGDPKLTLTNQNTQSSSHAYANTVRIGKGNAVMANATYYYGDCYVCDGSATAPNDYLGDIRVDITTPGGNGNSGQWTGADSDSTDNYQQVDDGTEPDGDVTYVESATAGQIDLYTYGDIPSGATLHGVEVVTLARKTDAGTRNIRVVTRQDSTNRTGTTQATADTYLYHSEVFPTAPDGSAWTAAKFNALEIGVELVS